MLELQEYPIQQIYKILLGQFQFQQYLEPVLPCLTSPLPVHSRSSQLHLGASGQPTQLRSKLLFDSLEIYLEAIIGPATKFHHTSLFIKREIFNIHFTGRMVNRWRLPFH